MSDEYKYEHLERAPRRLTREREDYLRGYPRHYIGGDSVHELLSEIDFLRNELKKARGADYDSFMNEQLGDGCTTVTDPNE